MTAWRISKVEPQRDGFAVSATDLAQALDLDPGDVQDLMRSGGIVTRFESGEGDDVGRYRLTFRHGGRMLRLTVDQEGTVLFQSSIELGPRGPMRR